MPPPKQLPPPPQPPAANKAGEKKDGAATAAAGIRREVHVLPRASPLASLVQREEWLSFVYHSCLFQVRDVRTPLDVPHANELPLCKADFTRKTAFELLKALAQTSQRNFVQLQCMMLDSQRDRSDDLSGPVYAPERKRDGHYVGLVNQGATWCVHSAHRHAWVPRASCRGV
jgi:hypothetical protein